MRRTTSSRAVVRVLALSASLAAVAACGRGGTPAVATDSAAGDVDLSMLTVEAQENRAVDRAIEHPVDFTLTEQRLEQLQTARERLAQVRDDEALLARGLDVREGRLTESRDVIGPMVSRLEQSGATRGAIEGAGLSVRDFVLGTFALQQALLAQRSPRREELSSVLLTNLRLVESNADRVSQLTAGSPFARVVETSAGGEVEDTHSTAGTSPRALVTPGSAAARATPPAVTPPREEEAEPRGRGRGEARGHAKHPSKGKPKGERR